MKKIVFAFFLSFIVTGCTIGNPTLSITPHENQKTIQQFQETPFDHTTDKPFLSVKYRDKNSYYVFLKASGEIEASVSESNRTAVIQFNVTNDANLTESHDYLFILNVPKEIDTISYQLNGEDIPIDRLLVGS